MSSQARFVDSAIRIVSRDEELTIVYEDTSSPGTAKSALLRLRVPDWKTATSLATPTSSYETRNTTKETS